MGKFPNSKLHGLVSDYHWALTLLDEDYKKLWYMDLNGAEIMLGDSIRQPWVERSISGVTFIKDLKWFRELTRGASEFTIGEMSGYADFGKHYAVCAEYYHWRSEYRYRRIGGKDIAEFEFIVVRPLFCTGIAKLREFYIFEPWKEFPDWLVKTRVLGFFESLNKCSEFGRNFDEIDELKERWIEK